MNFYQKLIISETHKFSCVLAPVKDPLASSIIDWAKSNIDKDDLAEDGYENDCHVTCLYGLHTQSSKTVKPILDEFSSFEIRLGSISRFTKNEDFDVVKIEIESSDLHEMNKKLSDLPSTITHSVYNPHLTLAYVKKGKYADLSGNAYFKGKTAKIDHVVFSSSQGEKTEIDLSSR